ncbi:hypothetical protein CsatB_011468 [Cannabis sativa]
MGDKLTRKVLLQGMLKDGLYQLQAPNTKPTPLFSRKIESNKPKEQLFSGVAVKSKSSVSRSKTNVSCVSKSDVWHRRLGHPSHKVLSQVLNCCQVKISKNEMNHFCDACQFGKSHALPFKPSNNKASNILDLIHSDLWGPSPIVSNNGYRFYIHFIDDCTRFTWIYPLKTKAEAINAFLQFKTFAETQFERKIKRLRTDGGGEYQALQDTALAHGIDFHHSRPHTSAQNGRAERKHRHIVEMGLTLLAQAHMPLKYWWEAFQTSVYLINRLPTPILDHKSPFEAVHGKKPDYAFLKVFGVACFPCIRPYQAHKFQFHSLKCVNLGYSEVHKGYKCLTPTGKIYISRNVVFNELEFPFKLGFLNNYQAEKPVIIQSSTWSVLPSYQPAAGFSVPKPATPPTSLSIPEETLSTPTHSQVNTHFFDSLHSTPAASHGSPISENERGIAISPAATFQDDFIIQPAEIEHSTNISPAPVQTTDHPQTAGHPMITRAKAGIFKPRVFMGHTHCNTETKEPGSVEEALSHPGWNKAMQSENKALKDNHTWVLVPPKPDQNLIGNKWVFREKLNSDGSHQRFKARLVAKGFHQRPGIDFGETFSPVIKATTVRIILTIAVTRGWEIKQLDINNAFLNGTLKEEVYMLQPQGFEEPGKEHYVCKLNKSLYGLKQAPRAWFDKLKSTLASWNFKNSKSDTSLFFYKHGTDVIFVLIYVDDIVVTGNNNNKLKGFISELNRRFTLKDLGSLHYFLGIEVYRDVTGLYLTQTKYIEDLLRRHNLTNLKPCPTPATAGRPMSITEGELLSNPTIYRSVIGGLQYLSHTRPDISYAVNKLSQFLKAPTTVHWNGAKRVLRYLKGTMHKGLHISCDEPLNLTGYSDADWACCPDDRRSIAGYCVFFGNTLVSWSSKKQPVVARSSTESEYRALAHVAAEISWIESLLKELNFKTPTAITWCDNMGANALASNPVFHARTKHIEVDVHFIRDKVLSKELDIRYVPSSDQVADCLTKGLSSSRFNFLIDKLGVMISPLHLRGDVKK